MSVRLRRLTREYEKLLAELAASEFVRVEVVSGDPPNSYRVTYDVPGLAWDESSGDAKLVSEHVVDIYLPLGYPKKQPHCTMRTPIWHPNIGDYVCIGDYWSPGVTLVDIIAHIGDMIQYRSYNLHSPVNRAAAAWAATRTTSFPIGDRAILPADTGETAQSLPSAKPLPGDIAIDLGPIRPRQ